MRGARPGMSKGITAPGLEKDERGAACVFTVNEDSGRVSATSSMPSALQTAGGERSADARG